MRVSRFPGQCGAAAASVKLDLLSVIYQYDIGSYTTHPYLHVHAASYVPYPAHDIMITDGPLRLQTLLIPHTSFTFAHTPIYPTIS